MYRQGEGGLCSNSLRTFFYYAIAARQNHPDAQRYLEQQVKSGDADAQYTWGYYYYLEKGAISEGIHWCVKAEMQGHQQALTYLEQTKFDTNSYLKIARQYESDLTNPNRNAKRALENYFRAVSLGNKESVFQLAHFYQVDHIGLPKDLTKSFDHYLQAAKLGHPEALILLERLGEEMSVVKQMELSNLYGTFFKNKNGDKKASYWRDKSRKAEGFKLRT
jgi:uncharacterized protein